MSEHVNDPLAEAVFGTPVGKAAVTGILVSTAASLPMLTFYPLSNSDIKAEELRIKDLVFQQDTLSDSVAILEERGDTNLASELQVKSDALSSEIASAKDNIPPHLTGDIANISVISAPFVLGALAGFFAYKKFKKQKN